MNLEAQIELMTVPQEFTRLCNCVLTAEFEDDFLPIDDDRPDNGNDGYRKSTRQIFAIHCFKRLQKQRITQEIRRKMVGDLGKAKMLKEQGLWDIEAWTFLANYAIPEEVGREIVALGERSGIEISWLGPAYFAAALQRHPEVGALFPALQTNDVAEQIEGLRRVFDHPERKAPDRVPRNADELKAVLELRPGGWEYLLFAGHLFLAKQSLELKWRDHEIPPYTPVQGLHEVTEASSYLSRAFRQVTELVEALMLVSLKRFRSRLSASQGKPETRFALSISQLASCKPTPTFWTGQRPCGP